MTRVVRIHQILVDAPLERVFEYVSDLTRHPEWSGGELKIKEVNPGPIAVGKEYFSEGEVALQKNRPNTVRVSEFEPPHRFGFVATDPDFGDVSHVFTLEQKEDSVRLTRSMTLSLNPVAALLFRFFVYPFVGGPSMDRSLDALKRRLEQNRWN